MRIRPLILAAGIALLPIPALAADASLIRMDAAPQKVVAAFSPFGGVEGYSLAAEDLGTDGVAELVAGSPPGEKTEVRVLRADGSRIFSFTPFTALGHPGVHVAVGDVSGDGKREIIVAGGAGTDGAYAVFDGKGKKFASGPATPFGPAFTGGANVSSGDVDGDGKDEIILAAGPGGGPHVRVWDGKGTLRGQFFAFDPALRGGTNVAAGDVDGDGKDEIIAAPAAVPSDGADAAVRIFACGEQCRGGSGDFALQKEFVPFAGYRGGLSIAVLDRNGDGKDELAIARAGSGNPVVAWFDGDGIPLDSMTVGDGAYRGGLVLAAGSFGTRYSKALIAGRAGNIVDSRPELPQYVFVDVKTQRLRAFFYGSLVNTFLVSTGLPKFPTPLGDFTVTDKPYIVRYQWSYGPGNPDNYDLGNVTWNLRFAPHIYIHYAPWHNAFGRRRSHGCVNVGKENAQWIYGWADVGTPVRIAG